MSVANNMRKLSDEIWNYANRGLSEPEYEKFMKKVVMKVQKTDDGDITLTVSFHPQIYLSLKKATITGYDSDNSKVIMPTSKAVCNDIFRRAWIDVSVNKRRWL